MGPRERIVLVAIVVAIGLLIRIGYLATTYVKDPLRTDAGQYVQYAENLVHHGVYSLDDSDAPRPDSFRSPGYPLFLAAAMWLAGADGYYALARWTQVVLGAATVLLAFALARQMLPYWGALATGALVALSPHLITCTAYILTETVFAFALLLGLWLLLRGARSNRAGSLAAAGLALGGAAWINETALLLAPLLFATQWRRVPAGARRGWVLGLLLFGLLTGAWIARNQLGVDAGDNSGARRAVITASHGSYPGWVHEDPRYRYSAYLEDPEQPEYGSSWQRFSTVWWERFRERPGRYLAWYLLEKPLWLWSWDILQGQGDVYVYPVADSLYVTTPVADATRLLMKALHWPLVGLAGLAALLAWRRRRDPDAGAVVAVVWTTVYFTAIYTVFAPWPRYSIPLRPELYALALWGAVRVVALVTEWHVGRSHRTVAPV